MTWGVVLLACFAAGMVVTAAVLRMSVAASAGRVEPQIEAGQVEWWSHVRERLGRRRWGMSGELWLAPDGTLHLDPDSQSAKRGAVASEWDIHAVEMWLGPRKWDISGARYVTLSLRDTDGRMREFACARQLGRAPLHH